MIGSGIANLGYYMMQSAIKENATHDGVDLGWLRGSVITTAGGSKFIRWTMFPNLRGGMDASQLPGIWKAWERGATTAMVEAMQADGRLTQKQAEGLLNRYEGTQAFSQPLTRAPQDIAKVLFGESSAGKYVGSRLASGTVPGWLREEAERLDEARHGVVLRKSKDFPDDMTALEKEFRRALDEYKKRTPSPPEGFADAFREYTRESLDPNTKAVGR